MEPRRTLLITTFALLLLAGPTKATETTPLSPPAVSSSNSGSDLSLLGSQEDRGSGTDGDDPPPTESTSSDDAASTPIVDPDAALRQKIYDEALANGRYVSRCVDDVNCLTPATAQPTAPAAPGQPPATVTIRDLATFIPSSTTLTMEPGRWMLRDAPANFIARAEQHTVTAPLLGQQADVRFTPIGFTFDYGDGSTKVTDTGGDTWADLGLDEFSETETSHVYTKRGYYDITASAVYVAEYRINGGGWTPVEGTLSVPTTHTGRTVTIDTVLVRGTCDEYPEDPGCPGWDPGPLVD